MHKAAKKRPERLKAYIIINLTVVQVRINPTKLVLVFSWLTNKNLSY